MLMGNRWGRLAYPSKGSAMNAEERRQAMADVLDVLHRARAVDDPGSLREILTDDVEHVMPSSFRPEPIVGRDTVAVELARVSPYFDPAIQRRIVRTTIEGNVAVLEQELNGQTGAGRPYSNVYVWVYEFRDLKIRRLIEYADTLRAARQFGMVAEE